MLLSYLEAIWKLVFSGSHLNGCFQDDLSTRVEIYIYKHKIFGCCILAFCPQGSLSNCKNHTELTSFIGVGLVVQLCDYRFWIHTEIKHAPFVLVRDCGFCTSYSSWSLNLYGGSLENGSYFVYFLGLCQDYQLFPEQEEHGCHMKGEKKNKPRKQFFDTVTWRVHFQFFGSNGKFFFFFFWSRLRLISSVLSFFF